MLDELHEMGRPAALPLVSHETLSGTGHEQDIRWDRKERHYKTTESVLWRKAEQKCRNAVQV